MNSDLMTPSRNLRKGFQVVSQTLRMALSSQSRNTLWFCVAVALESLVGVGLFTYLAYSRSVWQLLILTGCMSGLAVISALCILFTRRGQARLSIWIVLLAKFVVYFIGSLYLEGLGIWFTIAVIFYTLIASNLCMTPQDRFRAGLIGVIIALLILLVDSYFNKYQISTPVEIKSFVFITVGLVTLVYLFSLLVMFPDINLRGKITIAVFTAAIVTIAILTRINSQTYRDTLINNVNQTLRLAGNNTANQIDAYLDSLIAVVDEVAANPYTREYFLNRTSTSSDQSRNFYDFFRALSQEAGVDALVGLDSYGNIILHTSYPSTAIFDKYLGLHLEDRKAIDNCITSGNSFISSVIFPSQEERLYFSESYFYVGAQVTTASGTPLGVLLAAYPLSTVQDIVIASSNLGGDKSFAVLLDENYLRLAHGFTAEKQYTFIVPLAPELLEQLQQSRRVPEQSTGSTATDAQDFKAGLMQSANNPYFEVLGEGVPDDVHAAAAVPLSLKNWTLVFMQPRSVILLPIEQQNRTTILVTALISGLAILASALLARFISQPITQLTKAVEHASAGELSIRVPSTSRDEIGTLGAVFNSMIEQLQSTLQDLEKRVSERTSELTRTTEELAYRASRLQAVAEVAHAFTAVTDPNQLLSLVVDTISERFGFYHVGIFYIDRDGEYAVLMAANSEGGKRMLARGHRLRVGEEGIVGYVSRHGLARIALDVGADVVYFDNPDLPETRSEISLPLKVGDRVFGALDVQSTMPKAFDASDIAILSTLADQVAIAIENTRLINDARRTVHELELSQRLYVQQEWKKVVEEQSAEGYQYILGKLFPLSASDVDVSDSLTVMAPDGIESPDKKITRKSRGLQVPILLRGELIGVIELDDVTANRHWGEDEINLINAVADQVGLALENARLLATTRKRADRERLVSDITTKMRSTNDPQEILNTAVEQLRTALGVRSVKVHVAADQGNRDDKQE